MIVFLDVTIDLYQVRNWGQLDRLLKQELHNKSTCPLQVTDIYLTLSMREKFILVVHFYLQNCVHLSSKLYYKWKLQFLFFNKLNNKITEIVHELYRQPSYI